MLEHLKNKYISELNEMILSGSKQGKDFEYSRYKRLSDNRVKSLVLTPNKKIIISSSVVNEPPKVFRSVNRAVHFFFDNNF